MNNETKINVLTRFTEHRPYILNMLSPARSQNTEYFQQENTKSIEYMSILNQKPVSNLSLFSENIWDFNNDYPNAARNVKGAKLRINFSKYKDIPQFVLTEMKVIFELALLNNFIFNPKQNGGNSRTKGILKANSLISIFEAGLVFINEIFKQAVIELGYEFVQAQIKTLSDIGPELYHKAAANYERVKNRELDSFFKYLRSPASLKYVFEKPIAYVELNSLKWKNVANTDTKKKEQVLPDSIFESLSKITSFIIVDFFKCYRKKR